LLLLLIVLSKTQEKASLVEWLVEGANATATAETTLCESPIYCALKYSVPTSVDEFDRMAKVRQIFVLATFQKTMLMFSSAKVLIKKNCDVNLRSTSGDSALHLACRLSSAVKAKVKEGIVLSLLTQDANPNCTDATGNYLFFTSDSYPALF